MIIKKFTASTEAEAILLAKKELGMDAIVMNIKKNLPRGIYKLFRKPSVEITAAVDENGKQQKAKEEPVKRNPNIIYEDEVPTSLGGGSTAIEQRLDKLQDILENQITIRTNKLESDGGEEKEAVAEEDTDSNLACLQLIYNQMIANEVDETYANQMIGEIEHSLKKNTGMNNILTSMYQKIVLKLGQIHAIEAGKTQPKYIFFIGPTGVGKTTTIAKIASMLKMNKKKKIALMTADTYRIAAVEQLTTYANILDIPLHVVYSPEEVKEAKEKLKDYDIVLVDTAGRSYKNREQRDDLERLLNSVPEKEREVFLVLSATTKYYDLLKITDSYLQIVDYALIFTKLDETNCIGNLLNIRMKTGAPLSYATFGQNVPDDISAIDPQNIAKQLLGGSE
jgi:flagellar biosynthesis protein FlhF